MRSDTTPWGDRDLVDMWDNTLERVLALLSPANDDVLDRPVSTVPGTRLTM